MTDLLQHLGAWGAAGAAAITAAAVLLRRVSQDRTAIAKDRVEFEAVQRLLQERDAALKAASQYRDSQQASAEELSRVRAESAAQARDLVRLADEFHTFQRRMARLYPAARSYLDSDIVPMEGSEWTSSPSPQK